MKEAAEFIKNNIKKPVIGLMFDKQPHQVDVWDMPEQLFADELRS